MDLKAEALTEIEVTRKFFDRTTRCLTEEDSTFRPRPQMMSTAGQMAHAAQVIDWFREGVFDAVWGMDFEAAQAETERVESLAAARKSLADAWQRLRERVAASSAEELAATMPDNPILPGRSRYHVVFAIADHTGHHRGALAVYARLLGREPEMPYAAE